MSDLAGRIAAYITHRRPELGDVSVSGVSRIHGGSSQETFRFTAAWSENGARTEHKLILRRAPEGGLVVSERDLEFTVCSALSGGPVPVPAPHFLELDPQWLDRPFFIMDLVPGKPGQVFAAGDPYDGVGETVARNFWRHLGVLAKLDHRALGLSGLRGGADAGGHWARELDYWEASLDRGEAVVEPIVRGAIRWLRRNPPAEPAKPAICHGDYRGGNFLFLPDGTISAVLDWEMCHVSDPLEDVAWAVNPLWSMERILPLDEGLAIWEAASGLALDRAALDWWRLFVAVKSCGLWTTAEASFADGSNLEMIVALTSLRANHYSRMDILRQMEQRGAMA